MDTLVTPLVLSGPDLHLSVPWARLKFGPPLGFEFEMLQSIVPNANTLWSLDRLILWFRFLDRKGCKGWPVG